MSERSRDVDGVHGGGGRHSGVNHGACLFPRWPAVTRSGADSCAILAVVCGGSDGAAPSRMRTRGVSNGGTELPVLPSLVERFSVRIVRNCDCVYTAAVWFGCSGICRRSSATQRSSVKGIRAGLRRKHRSFRTQLFLTRYRHRLPFRLAVLSLADCWSGRPVLYFSTGTVAYAAVQAGSCFSISWFLLAWEVAED